MKREQAEHLLEASTKLGLGGGGSAVDPTRFLVLILDEGSIRGLYEALTAVRPEALRKSISERAQLVVVGLTEDCDQWLDANGRTDRAGDGGTDQ